MNLSAFGLFPGGIPALFLLGEYRPSERKAANPRTNVSLLNCSCSWFGGIRIISVCGTAGRSWGHIDLLQLIRSDQEFTRNSVLSFVVGLKNI